jgi:hypothetical protein
LEPIQVTSRKSDVKRHFNYFIKKEFLITYCRYSRLPFYLIGVTIITLIIFAVSKTTDLTKSEFLFLIVTLVFWAFTLLFLFFVLVKLIKRILLRNRTFKKFGETDVNYFIAFDNDKFITIADTFKIETNWEFYRYYSEDKEDVYIYPIGRSLYDALCVSKSEIGDVNYSELITIVRSKLVSFDQIHWFSSPSAITKFFNKTK